MLKLYPIAGCLCNNKYLFNSMFSVKQLANSFQNLDFRSVLFCFINVNNFIQKISFSLKNFSIKKSYIHSKICFHSKDLFSFKNFIFIQKLYFHSITFQFVYAGMVEQPRDCMISTSGGRVL